MPVVEIHAPDAEGRVVTLREDLSVVWRGRKVEVPAGFASDGASVPGCCQRLISPPLDWRTLRAALCHDYLYRYGQKRWSRRDADRLFRQLCRQDRLSCWRALLAYWGLRLFGGAVWKRYAATERTKEKC